MAKRSVRLWDEDRTALLDLEELLVVKGQGDSGTYFAWLQDPDVDRCPSCGGAVLKVHDLFPKTYYHIIEEDGKKRIISLIYQFYKYRCLNNECRHVFAKGIDFASQSDNVTYRLEDEIANLVISGYSYNEIAIRFSDSLSRQAVGQIFNRWVRNKEELRRIKKPPTSLVVVSGRTDNDRYILILCVDDGIRIFDILYGVSSADLSAKLRQYGSEKLETVISDCDPTIVDTINDNLPNATYVIPVQYWFRLVCEDFAEYSHDLLKWSPVKNKDRLIMLPEAELGYRVSDRDALLEARPAIVQPYYDFNELRDLISDREKPWTVNSLDTWATHVDPDFRYRLEATILRLNSYKDLIYQHELHKVLVPDKLCVLTARLEELISEARTFSDAQLKARALYSVPAELEDWRGVPIEDVIAALEKMNLQRRRNPNEYE